MEQACWWVCSVQRKKDLDFEWMVPVHSFKVRNANIIHSFNKKKNSMPVIIGVWKEMREKKKEHFDDEGRWSILMLESIIFSTKKFFFFWWKMPTIAVICVCVRMTSARHSLFFLGCPVLSCLACLSFFFCRFHLSLFFGMKKDKWLMAVIDWWCCCCCCWCWWWWWQWTCA